MLVSAVCRDNFTDITLPVHIYNAAVQPLIRDGRLHLLYAANMQVTDTVDVIMHRTLVCGPDQLTVDLPDIVKRYEPGNKTLRLLTMDAPIPAGMQCRMEVAINWLPTFSVFDHVDSQTPVTFFVPVGDEHDQQSKH
jgi:hypothetical protein